MSRSKFLQALDAELVEVENQIRALQAADPSLHQEGLDSLHGAISKYKTVQQRGEALLKCQSRVEALHNCYQRYVNEEPISEIHHELKPLHAMPSIKTHNFV